MTQTATTIMMENRNIVLLIGLVALIVLYLVNIRNDTTTTKGFVNFASGYLCDKSSSSSNNNTIIQSVLIDNNNNNYTESYNNELQTLAIKWRRLAGETFCKLNNNHPDMVGPTGGWCLIPHPKENWGKLGRAAKHHVIADNGLATGIAKYLTNNNTETITLYDIGAGVGQYGHWFRENNVTIEWSGFDGAENIESFTNGFVTWIDVTEPYFDTIPTDNPRADWIISLEVGEHIPSNYTNTFLDLLDKHNRFGIILSWAIPGQGGHSHINHHTNNEIIQLLSYRGYIQDEWTNQFQKEVRTTCSYWWFQNTFMVFKRQIPILE